MYQRVIKLQPENAESYLQIASIYYYDLKENSNALAYFKKTLEISPNHPDKSMILQMITAIEQEP